MNRFLRFFPPAVWLLLLVGAPAWAEEATNKLGNAFLEVVTANFSRWDTNHDRTLSAAELDAAIENPANQGPAAAALATLRRASFATNAPPLTLANIRKLADDKDLKLRLFYSQSLGRIKRVTHHELFASGLPQLTTIHQGRMGNCFCLAPLGAMLYRDPHEVAAWFEVQSNGNVLVQMPAGAVSVPPPTDAELAFASGNSQDGVWINLYEKAIGEARNERKPPGKRLDEPLDAIAKGGSEAPILSYITGHKARVVSLRFGTDAGAAASKLAQLRQQMAYACSNRLLMVGATSKPTTPGLTPHHAYALLDYNSEADEVKVWNPHGNTFKPKGTPGLTNGYFTTNGLFTIPLPELANQFSRVILERPERTPLQWPDQWELKAEAGHFAEAAADLTEVITSDESENGKLFLLTPLLIQSGRIADYTNHCKSMLDQFATTTNPAIAERVAKSCLLLPSAMSPEDLVRATNLAARAVTLSAKGAWLQWRLMTRGLAQFRSGCYEDALKTEALSLKAATQAPDLNAPACVADAYFISAMVREQLKQNHHAHSDWERGRKLVQTKLPKLDDGDLGLRWFDTLTANILMREAGAAVEGTAVGG